MKKVLLSVFVVVSFVIYSLSQRNQNANVLSSTQDVNGGNTLSLPPANTNSSNNNSNSITKIPSPTVTLPTGIYKDGQYTGSVADAFYGYIQVQAVIQNGRISDVVFLQYPNDRENSIRINTIASRYLRSEAIQAQSANVDIITGATDTSKAFVESLRYALSQARS